LLPSGNIDLEAFDVNARDVKLTYLKRLKRRIGGELKLRSTAEKPELS